MLDDTEKSPSPALLWVFVTAAYTTVRLIPQPHRALDLELFSAPIRYNKH
ncbi:hypothetical protein [Geobacter sp. AOG1]|nr:hypothetical protein [Geobacter sp. AOG1]